MPSGGKRSGAGRKKVEVESKAPNKARATTILDGLALSDEEWKAQGHPDRKPKDDPDGKPKDDEPRLADFQFAGDFKRAHDAWEDAKRCQCEDCLWRRDCLEPGAGGRETRRYLWDRRDGHSVRNINHIHDKPIDLNVNISMAEVIRGIRTRKQEYERSRK